MIHHPLQIRVQEFSEVLKTPQFINKLRKLTLDHCSGMNHELNHLIKDSSYRPVECKIMHAYKKKTLVAWALLSKEATDYKFGYAAKGFQPSQGVLFQVFVHPEYRRQGIGSELVKVARRKAGAARLCFCPWDRASDNFYERFNHYNHQKL